ncbi:hypothetical protein ACH5BK_09495 [Arcobacter sp. YIC-80]|uniref:hypothetical protein n=1 Tax=Arcobacter sp. YIC-80 TaxID=3376683 RepID=UPI00384B6F1D
MFSKESLYINAIKYDTQLKLDYKKLDDEQIIEANNSVFLVKDEILSHEIAHKINASQKQTPITYISTLLISDTTKLIPKNNTKKPNDCEIAHFNSDYDIAVLKTTLFETQHYFEKTGIDYIYSAFHILNLHIEQKVCKNQLLIFLFNNKAFILILDENSKIVYSKTVELPTFESVKKTHFYDDDVVGQKLFDEIYYLELSEIIHNNLNEFYEKESQTFIDKITILYTLKQLSQEQIDNLSNELLLAIDYQPINIDEEIFELSKDKHQKQSFIRPRKKEKKNNYFTIFIILFFLISFYGVYLLFDEVKDSKETQVKVEKNVRSQVKLPDHVNKNDKITKRIEAIFDSIPYDVVLNEMVVDGDALLLKAKFLKDDTFIKSLQPELGSLYETIEVQLESKDKKYFVDGIVMAKDLLDLEDIKYKTYTNKYIVDEFFPISRVTEQLKILMPENAIVKFQSSQNNKITKFNYLVNIEVFSPKEFFALIDLINNELYSISISYPISMIKNKDGKIEIEFNVQFSQPQ